MAPHGRAYHANFAASLTGEVPGTVDLVRRLKAAGVPQCGLTNWSHELYHARDRAVPVPGRPARPRGRVGDRADRQAGPAHLPAGRRAQRPPLERLVFVDDKAANVASAQQLGMAGVVFTDAERLGDELRALGLPV